MDVKAGPGDLQHYLARIGHNSRFSAIAAIDTSPVLVEDIHGRKFSLLVGNTCLPHIDKVSVKARSGFWVADIDGQRD